MRKVEIFRLIFGQYVLGSLDALTPMAEVTNSIDIWGSRPCLKFRKIGFFWKFRFKAS